MELQQARIRGVAHCIIPQEFTIKKPIAPLPPPLILLPVVVGQSPAVQLSGAPAVVQVLVPSNQIIPNQIPVLIPSNVQQAPVLTQTLAAAPAPLPIAAQDAPVEVAPSVTTPEPSLVEVKTVSSYILDSSTQTNKPKEPTTTTTTTTTPAPVKIEDSTEVEMPPEFEPELELEPIKEVPEAEVALSVPNSSRMLYSADPPQPEDDELLSNGILGVSSPEVIMPPVAESSHRKLVMEDPPEMLHDQEMPPAPTLSVDDVDV